MFSKKVILVVVAALCVGGAGVALTQGSQVEPESVQVAAKPSNRALQLAHKTSYVKSEARMEALERELAELKKSASATAHPAATKEAQASEKEQGPAQAQDPAAYQRTLDQLDEEEEQAFEAIVQDAADRFDDDQPDLEAATLETQMREFLLSKNYEGLTIDSVECRSKQCQIVINHKESGSREQIDDALTDDLFEGGTVVHFSEDLAQTMIFAVRDASDS